MVEQVYSLDGVVKQPPMPISALRAPTTGDKISPDGSPYEPGTTWTNRLTTTSYIYAGNGVWNALAVALGLLDLDTLNLIAANPVSLAHVVLTSAQVKALRANPVTIIPAPVGGKSIQILSAKLKLKYGSSPFTNPQPLVLRYNGATGVVISSTISSVGFLDQSTSMYTSAMPLANAIVPAVGTENRSIVLHNVGASEITGNATNDNSLIVLVEYVTLNQ